MLFTARRYASAVYAVVVCPSVHPPIRPSVCPLLAGVVSKPLNESSWVLAWMLPSICSTLRFKELWVTPKITVLPPETLLQTPDLENFATASRSRCQQNSSTVEPADDIYATVNESTVTL